MSVLERKQLEESPLADLHALAAEMGVEGYRGLRREDLISALLRAGGGDPGADDDGGADAVSGARSDGGETSRSRSPRPRTRRPRERRPAGGDSGGSRGGDSGGARGGDPGGDDAGGRAGGSRGGDSGRRSGSSRGGDSGGRDSARRGRSAKQEAAEDGPDSTEEDGPEEVRSGVLHVLGNGSGFLRADPFRQSDDDAYVSPAQIRRCELRSGDEISGPVRPPRRSERHPSLVRVDSVNGSPAEPPAERPWFDALTPVYATERLPGPDGAPPFGRGSRVVVSGAPGSGATTLLRLLAGTVSSEGVELVVVLAGVRPEEVAGWRAATEAPVVGGSFESPADERTQAAEVVLEQAKRRVERGAHTAIVVDGLDALPDGLARRLFGAARRAEEGGSLTVIASARDGELEHWATTALLLEPRPEGGEGVSFAPRSRTLRADLLA